MNAFGLFALVLTAAVSQASENSCYFEKSLNQCFVLPAESLNAQIVVPAKLQTSVCIRSLCIANDPKNAKAKAVIVLDGEGYKGPFVAELEPARDHDGDIMYGYYNYSVKLHDSVEAKGTRKVQCKGDSNPNCWWYEHDVYRAATLTLSMRLYDGRGLDYFSISALFYDASQSLEDGPIVQSVDYYKTAR